MRCLIHNCENCSELGTGKRFDYYDDGKCISVWICSPCFSFINHGGMHLFNSQFERNAKKTFCKIHDCDYREKVDCLEEKGSKE